MNLKKEIVNEVKTHLDNFKHFAPIQPKDNNPRRRMKMFSVDISTLSNWQKSKNDDKSFSNGSDLFFYLSEVEASLKPLNV
jgi:hypothetical protein